jgi:hypothetical protein
MLNAIVRSGSSLEGTRPFWNWLRKQLLAFMPVLGIPSAFITLSPTDLYWESLYRHRPAYNAWKEADDSQRIKITCLQLRDNPYIAAWHFYLRNKLFREVVLKEKFGLTNWWYRFEW